MAKQSLLNEEQTRVNLFLFPIVLDKNLPKYQLMGDKKSEKDEDVAWEFSNSIGETSNASKLDTIDYSTLQEWLNNHEKESITDFNVTLSDKMRNNIEQLSVRDRRLSWQIEGMNIPQKETLWNVIKGYFKKKNKQKQEKKNINKFDVVKFFDNVKLATQSEVEQYRNRLADYITCIGYAEKAGQVALKEKLFEKLIINKYESVLYAKGFTKVLTEEQLVKFAQNCPKALSLDYIANYTRTIPIDAVKKVMEINKFEVFDNYVILHYDPEGNSVAMTNKEKEEEIRKAKDPILFGVISGSNKLYYICDWIDEVIGDDLTWDTVVDSLGKEILERGFLTEKID